MELTIISGMQTGSDQAALYAAEFVGFKTGGLAPKDFKTLDGNKLNLGKRFNVQESTSSNYKVRTEWNVVNSDATLVIATNLGSSGEILTYNLIKKHKKNYFRLKPNQDLLTPFSDDVVQDVVDWILAKDDPDSIYNLFPIDEKNNYPKIRTLNVAGNSEKTSPGIQEYATNLLIRIFTKIKKVNVDL